MKILLLLLLLSLPITTYAITLDAAFSPRQGATELVISTIKDAKQTIRVAAYSFTSAPVAKALLEAHKKGIDVKVVLDKSQKTAKYSSYTFLKNQNIPVRINRKYAIMHNKFIIVDGKTLQMGSYNYTKAAEEKNAENVLVIKDAPEIVKQYSAQWDKLWAEGE